MAEVNFTPGPWRRLSAGDEFDNEIAAEGVDSWTTVGTPDCPVALVISSNADDALIRAAPELYEALIQAEACMSIVEPRSDKAEYLRIIGVVRAALARARGE